MRPLIATQIGKTRVPDIQDYRSLNWGNVMKIALYVAALCSMILFNSPVLAACVQGDLNGSVSLQDLAILPSTHQASMLLPQDLVLAHIEVPDPYRAVSPSAHQASILLPQDLVLTCIGVQNPYCAILPS